MHLYHFCYSNSVTSTPSAAVVAHCVVLSYVTAQSQMKINHNCDASLSFLLFQQCHVHTICSCGGSLCRAQFYSQSCSSSNGEQIQGMVLESQVHIQESWTRYEVRPGPSEFYFCQKMTFVTHSNKTRNKCYFS